MAIELTDDLIELQRAANTARDAALAVPYTSEGWQPWRDAAATVQVAVAEYAAATGQPRHEVEQAVKNAAKAADEG